MTRDCIGSERMQKQASKKRRSRDLRASGPVTVRRCVTGSLFNKCFLFCFIIVSLHVVAHEDVMAGGLLKKSQVFTDWPGLKKGDLYQGRDLHSTIDSRSIYASAMTAVFDVEFDRLRHDVQSIRRRAVVTLRATASGYTLEVVVQKEIEDTDRSQLAAEGNSSQRHDGTLLRHTNGRIDGPRTLGWIPLGRDATLEQRLLHEIHGRVTQSGS